MRLFIAIDIPGNVKKKLEALQEYIDKDVFRLASSFHLTLFFLGECKKDKASLLAGYLEKIRYFQFDLNTTDLGFFSRKEYVSVLWLGIEDEPRLKNLRYLISEMIKKTGLVLDEKGFCPHLTIARAKKPVLKKEIENLLIKNLGNMTIPVKSIILYESILEMGMPPRYEKLKEIKFL